MGVPSNMFGMTVAAVAVWLGYMGATKEDFVYRVTQAAKAVWLLKDIPEERVQNFLESFKMYEMESFTGTPDQLQLVKDYYETLNHLCCIGDYEKMYLPPMVDASKDTYSNQRLYERRMAHRLNVGPGAKVLDIGCGRGRIAHLVASTTGAHVTGLQLDTDQLRQCREFAAEKGMTDQLDFIEANYNERLPFPDESFDAVYYVQVIGGYGTNLTSLYKEAYRVLKPGGIAAFEDYILMDGYNSSDAKHKRLVQSSKAFLGVVHFFTDKEFTDALSTAGFETLRRGNASVGDQVRLLEADRDYWLPLTSFIEFLNSMQAIPKRFASMLSRMTKGVHDCIEAHHMRILTGDVETVVRKPIKKIGA